MPNDIAWQCTCGLDGQHQPVEPHITTFTKRKVNPLALRAEDICIEDIAHHLATTNRWVGAVREPINVALHSVHVSRLLQGTGWELEGLLHDSQEAYLGDMSRWVKRHPSMLTFREAEDRAWKVICTALGLRETLDPAVKEADHLMVRFEAYESFGEECHLFEQPTHPLPTQAERMRVLPWHPFAWRISETMFLTRFWELSRSTSAAKTSGQPRKGLTLSSD